MNDIEVLGLEVQDYSQYKSKKNNNKEMIDRIEKINLHHDNYQKYHVINPIKTEENYKDDSQFYIVSSHFGQMDWMSYGYTDRTYINAKNYDDVLNYCEERFGKNTIGIYYNIEYNTYVIKKVSAREYLIEVNKILNRIKEYENLECINDNWRNIGYKICISNGIALQAKNGKIEYEGRGELEKCYKPKELDEIIL